MSFVRRALIGALIAGLALVAAQLASVFMLLFGAIVVATLVHALAKPLAKVGIPHTLGVLVAVLLIMIVFGTLGWLFNVQIKQQLDEVARSLPSGLTALRGQLATLPFGEQLSSMSIGGAEIAGRIMSAATTTFGVIANTIVVLIAGIYLAISPNKYVEGVATLFPPAQRPRVTEALAATGRAIGKFLGGQFITMVVDGMLAGVGLWLIGVPAPIALGLILAICNFVPTFGPLIGAVPGVLLALTVGPQTALYALLVYLAVQQTEGNLLSPLIQQRAVALPPVLLLFGLLGFGVLFGPLGVVFGAPATVALYTLVTVLYVRDTLGDQVSVPGADGTNSKAE